MPRPADAIHHAITREAKRLEPRRAGPGNPHRPIVHRGGDGIRSRPLLHLRLGELEKGEGIAV
ncbi:hypothetical protein LBMAG55_15710 [Verrucomicrobiota bacterium]|nr:hypothetical protein LBMAG55_15710 [Verrucomicrobiota bacterium]